MVFISASQWDSVTIGRQRGASIGSKHVEDFAGALKTADRRMKHPVLALHRATTKSDMSLTCAKLMFFFKKSSTCRIIHYFCGRDEFS